MQHGLSFPSWICVLCRCPIGQQARRPTGNAIVHRQRPRGFAGWRVSAHPEIRASCKLGPVHTRRGPVVTARATEWSPRRTHFTPSVSISMGPNFYVTENPSLFFGPPNLRIPVHQIITNRDACCSVEVA